MKRFSFRLQKVLDLRSFEERETEIELGRAVSEKTILENALAENAQERVSAILQKRTLDIADYAAVDMYVSRLDTKKESLLTDIAKAELVIEEKKARYLAAHQKKEILTKLREKKEAQYRADCAAKENAAILDLPHNDSDLD